MMAFLHCLGLIIMIRIDRGIRFDRAAENLQVVIK